jgi:hypothetical protein
MNNKKIIQAAIIVVLCAFINLLVVAPSYAARIYNEIQEEVSVFGTGPGFAQGILDILLLKPGAFPLWTGPKATIRPGERSDSLNWNKALGVAVQLNQNNIPTPVRYCFLDFGTHKEIVGGNYMIIRDGGKCVVCNASRQPVAGSGSCS